MDELKKMGASVLVEGRTAIIEGIEKLSGANVRATDLRAGAAMVIAGLIAEGKTEISDVEHIYRGYPNIVQKFEALGANISVIKL
jgi:UDP-N-acetylglucosamine 1-carboxyvinyltransferase